MSVIEKRSAATRQRKSTLTQQQKNKKRQRATPKQLNTLRSEFMFNSTPNAKIREEIGRKIDMTERSVQIWFQNKRAKAKQLTSRNTGGYNGHNQYLGNGDHNNYYANSHLMTPPMSATGTFPMYGNGSVFDHMNTGSEINLLCTALSIGSWRRITSHGANDLHVAFSMLDNSITYTMFAGFTGFRVKSFIKDVKSLHYSKSVDLANTGDVFIQLLKTPLFFIQTAELQGAWVPCDDFSEAKQASYVLLHQLSGPDSQLQMSLAQIATIDPLKVTGLNADQHTIIRQSLPMSVNYRHMADDTSTGVNYLSLPPEKVRSMSMPTAFSKGDMSLQDGSSDDELFIDMGTNSSVALSGLSSDGTAISDTWPFHSSMLATEELTQSFPYNGSEDILSFEENISRTPEYIIDNKKGIYFDEVLLNFTTGNEPDQSLMSPLSISPIVSTGTDETKEFGLENDLLLDSDLLMTTSAIFFQ